MKGFKTQMTIGLSGLFILFCFTVNGQPDSDGKIKHELIGLWGMFKDRHPDGWGSWNPPYEYLEFKNDGSYIRTYLNKGGNGFILGRYEVIHDSIVFHDNVLTDGTTKGKFKNSTSKIYSVISQGLELWEDWDRILSKRVKKFGHKKKYRPLTIEEKEKLELLTTKIISDLPLIKNFQDQNSSEN